MQISSFIKAESFSRFLQGVAVGIFLTLAFGLGGGWLTLGSTAEKMAADRTNAALVRTFTPTCADKFFAQPDAAAKLVALSEVASWRRDQEVAKTGFATLPGESVANMGVADSCADAIVKAKR